MPIIQFCSDFIGGVWSLILPEFINQLFVHYFDESIALLGTHFRTIFCGSSLEWILGIFQHRFGTVVVTGDPREIVWILYAANVDHVWAIYNRMWICGSRLGFTFDGRGSLHAPANRIAAAPDINNEKTVMTSLSAQGISNSSCVWMRVCERLSTSTTVRLLATYVFAFPIQ